MVDRRERQESLERIEAHTVALERKFDAKRFPPKEFEKPPFTYLLHRYFEGQSDKLHLINAH